MQLLQKSGVQIAIVLLPSFGSRHTTDGRPWYSSRLQGQRDKKIAFRLLQQTLNLEAHQIACMGDDTA